MSEQEQMKQLADHLAPYIWNSYIEPKLADLLHFYPATVAAQESGGKIKVKKPFEDNAFEVKCVESAKHLNAGDTCIVVYFGSASNSFVIGDTMLTNL